MKSTAFGTLLKEVIGGTPAEVAIKILLAAVVALWDNLQVIGPSVFLYFCALAVDAIMGAMVSGRKGKAFSASHFITGPFKKLGLTTGMMFVAAIADSMIPQSAWIPDQPIFFGVITFVGVTTLLDVARKYGKLTGSKLIVWLEEKLGGYIKTKDEDLQG